MARSLCTIKLYSNFPINDYSNQVYYNDENARDSAFDSYCSNRKNVDIFYNIASVDKTSMTFRLQTNYKNAMHYNYGVVIEDNKRYYFFIDNIIWSSNLVTATFCCTVDWWQTYCYDVTFKKSFVEREHVEDDTFGKHILDEGLPTSQYVVESSTVLGGNDFYFMVSISDTSLLFVDGGVGPGDKLPSLFQPTKNQYSTCLLVFNDLDSTKDIINWLVAENKIDAIQGVYLQPKNADIILGDCMLFGTDNTLHDGNDFMKGINYVKAINKNPTVNKAFLGKPTTIQGYTPNNNKCFCYPYCFGNFTNNNGASLVGQFELTVDNVIEFCYYFPIGEGQTSYGYLAHYDGVNINLDYSITGLTNPELPWVSNTYSAYMSANQNSIANEFRTIGLNKEVANAMNIADTIGSFANMLSFGSSTSNLQQTTGSVSRTVSSDSSVGSFSTGGLAGNIINPFERLVNNELTAYNAKNKIDATLKDVQSKGNIAHGSFTSNAQIIEGQYGFKMQLMTVTKENIEMIDNYFDMFGYKVNVIKVPQFNSRLRWNYIKTSAVNVIGNIPQIALLSIKKMFDNGTTIWHQLNNMYDYSLNNDIVK